MRVLVVEDDPAISGFVVRGLREEHYVVDLAEDGAAAGQLAADNEYDAIVLDVMLPKLNGFELCRLLRRDAVDAPIIMLTARDAVRDRIAGLDAGADDYVVKPFAFDELLARLRAVTRRGRSTHVDPTLTCGPLRMHTDSHIVEVDGGAPIELSATEYRLLEHLLRHPAAIISREQLADHVWGAEYDPSSNLADVYIGYLRRKLRAAGIVTPMIHTVRGMGYMLRDSPMAVPA